MGLQYRRSERERLGKIIDAVSNLDYRELFSYWITQETRKAEIYYSLAQLSGEVTWDERVSKYLTALYNESIDRAQILLRAFKEQFPQEKPLQLELPSLEVELSQERLREMLYRGSFKEVLEYLTEIEKLSMEVYRYLEEKATDESVRKLFSQLSKMGEEHLRTLEDLQSTLLDEGQKESGV